MKNNLGKIIFFTQQVKPADNAIDPKIIFLNNGLIITSLITCIMGIARWHADVVMSMMDFIYTAIGIGIVCYLRKHENKIELVSSIVLVESVHLTVSAQ